MIISEKYRWKKLLAVSDVATVDLYADQAGGEVAIKVAKRYFEDYIGIEAGVLSRLNHPSIVKFIETGLSEESRPALVTRFVSSIGYERLLSLPVDDAITVIENAANGLQVVHDSGIVHRDIKPSNFAVQPNKEVTLLDFATCAPAPDALDFRHKSIPNRAIGTPDYMSAEAMAGQISPSGDVYSLGVAAYEFLTRTRANRVSPGSPIQKYIASHQAISPQTYERDLGSRRTTIYDALQHPLWSALKFADQYRPSAAAFGAAMRETYEQAAAESRRSRQIVL